MTIGLQQTAIGDRTAARELALIERYFALSPEGRAEAWKTMSREERTIVRQAEGGGR